MTPRDETEIRVRRHPREEATDQNARPNYGVLALGAVVAVLVIWLLAALLIRPVSNLPPQVDSSASEQSPAPHPPAG